MRPFTQNGLKKIFFLYSLFFLLNSNGQTVTTFAGNTEGFADGVGTAAQFHSPNGLAIDAAGNVYVADSNNHRIRKITSAGVVSTLAGSTEGFADGTGTAARFYGPVSVAVDATGNVYVADTNNHRIRKITAAGVVTTLAGSTGGFADGTGTTAQFYYPNDVAIDNAGNVYVTDTNNHRIRKITAAGVVTTLAGSTGGFADGMGTAVQFNFPYGLTVDTAGNVYVADTNNHRIRKITAAGVVTTLAGSGTIGFADGTATTAKFYNPTGIAIDSEGTLFVADEFNNRIRKITPTAVVTTLAGSTQGFADGIGTTAQFNHPYDLTIDTNGSIFIGDQLNNRIRKITTNLATTNFQSENQASIYPNPASTLINIKLEDSITAKITLFDINSRVVQSENLIDNETTIYIGNLVNGIYLMQITTDKGTISKKLVKQ